MNINTFVVALLVAVAAGGCASAPETSKPPPSVFDKSQKVFGPDRAILAWVPADGAIADTTFSAASTAAPSRMARGLARTLSMGASGQIAIAAAGPNSSKTRRVVTDALSLQSGALPGLRLLFIGDETDRDAVRAAVESRGGKFFFESYE
ncbi:MAG TPA: hypothetical protein VLD18_04620 [Verrucomicrobiae bacterium]|nr:hypothetical protein [Verrucomicrobiae bacterium]